MVEEPVAPVPVKNTTVEKKVLEKAPEVVPVRDGLGREEIGEDQIVKLRQR